MLAISPTVARGPRPPVDQTTEAIFDRLVAAQLPPMPRAEFEAIVAQAAAVSCPPVGNQAFGRTRPDDAYVLSWLLRQATGLGYVKLAPILGRTPAWTRTAIRRGRLILGDPAQHEGE